MPSRARLSARLFFESNFKRQQSLGLWGCGQSEEEVGKASIRLVHVLVAVRVGALSTNPQGWGRAVIHRSGVGLPLSLSVRYRVIKVT